MCTLSLVHRSSPSCYITRFQNNKYYSFTILKVDGVYLGRSGWVQVQQRSLDDNRRATYLQKARTTSLQQQPAPPRRTTINLSDYRFNSEPGKGDRPAYLSLPVRDIATPSPAPEEEFSPPSVTPIISPPPAFQDHGSRLTKSRTFFGGKTPFLPRSNAIEDSDASPPITPTPPTPPQPSQTKRKIMTCPVTVTIPPGRKPKVISPAVEKPPRAFNRMPQTKSLEDTTATRR